MRAARSRRFRRTASSGTPKGHISDLRAMLFLGEIAALLTACCWATGGILFSRAGTRIGGYAVNLSRLALALLLVVLLHLAMGQGPVPPMPDLRQGLLLAISALLGLVVGDSLLFHAYATIGPRLGSLMTATVPILGAVIAWIFLGEVLPPLAMAGVVVGVSGIGLVIWGLRGGKAGIDPRTLRIGLVSAFGAAFGQTLHLVAVKQVLTDGMPAISVTLWRTAIACAAIWGAELLRGRALPVVRDILRSGQLPVLALAALIGPTIGIYLSNVAVQSTQLGVAATLMALPPVLLIPYERFVLGRPIGLPGVTGTVAAIVGVALLFLG